MQAEHHGRLLRDSDKSYNTKDNLNFTFECQFEYKL